jgi:hypothetical protein
MAVPDRATLSRGLRPHLADPSVECAQRAFDARGGRYRFPDLPSGPSQPRELQYQQLDLAAVGAAGPQIWEAVLTQRRHASQAHAVEFSRRLRQHFTMVG